MKILSQRCRTFEYEVTTASPCSVPLDPSARGSRHSFTDCLALLVGIEVGDNTRVKDAAKAVRRIIAKTAAEGVVINGFSQLADPALRADAPSAIQALAALAERLTGSGATVHLMPFGWNKRWRADVLDGEWEQRIVHLAASDRIVELAGR